MVFMLMQLDQVGNGQDCVRGSTRRSYLVLIEG